MFVVTRATVGVLALSAYATVQVRMPRVAPAVLFLLVALVGKTLVKESEGLAKPLLQPPSGPSQDFTAGRALAMEQMREVAARPHACSPRPPAPLTPLAAPLSLPQRVPRRLPPAPRKNTPT